MTEINIKHLESNYTKAKENYDKTEKTLIQNRNEYSENSKNISSTEKEIQYLKIKSSETQDVCYNDENNSGLCVNADALNELERQLTELNNKNKAISQAILNNEKDLDKIKIEVQIAQTKLDRANFINQEQNPNYEKTTKYYDSISDHDENIVNGGAVTQGGVNDCAIFAAINNLSVNPEYANKIAHMVKKEVDSNENEYFIVSLPNKTIKVSMDSLMSRYYNNGTNGDEELLALAYAVRQESKSDIKNAVDSPSKPKQVKNMDAFLNAAEPYSILTGKQATTQYLNGNKISIEDFSLHQTFGIKTNSNNDKKQLMGIAQNHAYEIIDIDKQKNTITITDSRDHKTITLSVENMKKLLKNNNNSYIITTKY